VTKQATDDYRFSILTITVKQKSKRVQNDEGNEMFHYLNKGKNPSPIKPGVLPKKVPLYPLFGFDLQGNGKSLAAIDGGLSISSPQTATH